MNQYYIFAHNSDTNDKVFAAISEDLHAFKVVYGAMIGRRRIQAGIHQNDFAS